MLEQHASHQVSRALQRALNVLQVVSGTASMYGCNSSIKWNPTEYIPVVNDRDAVNLVRQVAESMSSVHHFEELDRPTFMAEDVAFFNGRHTVDTLHKTSSQCTKVLSSITCNPCLCCLLWYVTAVILSLLTVCTCPAPLSHILHSA